MAADGVFVKLEGVDELTRVLRELPTKIRKQALRKALREGAKAIQKEARQNAPVLAVATPRRKPGTLRRQNAPVLAVATPRRKPGTLRRNIVIRASKFARRAGGEGVFVSVRPLRGARQQKLGKAGAKNPNDPYYWWWQEFGWVAGGGRIKGGKRRRAAQRAARIANGTARQIPGKKFLTNAAKSQGQQAINTVMSVAIPIINKLNSKA